MSSQESYYYELERRRREELERQRVAQNVREYLYRYRESINSIVREGLDRYISLENVNRSIREIESLLNTNPFLARDMSYGVQSEIYSLRNRAIEAKKEEERLIREQKSRNKEKILEIYYKNIRAIDDPILVDFAKDKFDSLKKELLEEDGKTDKDMGYYTAEIERRINNIINNANSSASEWRAKKEREREKRILETKIEIIEEELNNEKTELKENEEKKNELLKHIENAKKSLSNENIENIDISNIDSEIDKISKESENIAITEEVRRDVVKSIIKSLKDSEFTVEHPEIIQDDEGGIVKITAKKPSGKRAVCKVGLNGKLEYRFDNYEGLTCVKDIDKFTKELEEIYSIKLSDKRVIWENPDRISKGALDIDNDNRRTL